MARRFAKVSEEEMEEAYFFPSDLVNTKTTIHFRVGKERWIYTSTLRVSVYIHHFSPPLQGIVVYYSPTKHIHPNNIFNNRNLLLLAEFVCVNLLANLYRVFRQSSLHFKLLGKHTTKITDLHERILLVYWHIRAIYTGENKTRLM